ncbi:MAG TPA: sigma-70 family RNA polymerase sigma factor [Trebonia sp.]
MTVNNTDWQADFAAHGFEEHRAHLRSVAYRMLGSLTEAEDAVQEAWLRLSRADTGNVRDLRAWLTTVVSRVCLDMLRSRASRREDSLDSGVHVPDPIVTRVDDDPAEHAIMADSVGIALLVVLDTLSPAERLAFVLHDVFAVPFEQIGPILDRSPAAAKQLASRARRRLRTAPAHSAVGHATNHAEGQAAGDTGEQAADQAGETMTGSPGESVAGAVRGVTADLSRQWAVVDAFLAASRAGDFERLLTILDPDVVLRADAGTGPFGPSTLVRGAREVIANARRFAPLGRFARPVLVNGGPGFLVVRDGEPLALMAVTVHAGRITEMDVLADPDRLARLDLTAVLPSAEQPSVED